MTKPTVDITEETPEVRADNVYTRAKRVLDHKNFVKWLYICYGAAQKGTTLAEVELYEKFLDQDIKVQKSEQEE